MKTINTKRAGQRPAKPKPRARRALSHGFELPRDVEEFVLKAGADGIRLTNLQKVFWPAEGYTKRDLLQYYLDVSRWLLPHVQDRAMVMKRYPNGITGEFFFMKRYNQNAWNRTLASVYSVRPKPRAPVSTPVTWREVERGVRIEDFTMQNAPRRLSKIGDLWRPLLAKNNRMNLKKIL